MAEFTLLKLQLDDASFTANAPFSDGDGDEYEHDTEDTDEGAGSLLALLVGLVFLILLGVAAKKLLGNSGEEMVDVSE